MDFGIKNKRMKASFQWLIYTIVVENMQQRHIPNFF